MILSNFLVKLIYFKTINYYRRRWLTQYLKKKFDIPYSNYQPKTYICFINYISKQTKTSIATSLPPIKRIVRKPIEEKEQS